MSPEQLWETTMNPMRGGWCAWSDKNFSKAKETFEKLMDAGEAEERRNWMREHWKTLKRTSKKNKPFWERRTRGHAYWLGKHKLGRIARAPQREVSVGSRRQGGFDELEKARAAVELAVIARGQTTGLVQVTPWTTPGPETSSPATATRRASRSTPARLPRLRGLDRQGARAAGDRRRAEAGAAAHPVRDERRRRAGFAKCARYVGEVLGKYHPHGDSSTYEAMVHLAQPFSMRYPLIDGQGNFGSVMAMRPRRIAIRKQGCPLRRIPVERNRGGHRRFHQELRRKFDEPVLLPARLPFGLLNGSFGIPVGFSTRIPSHNLKEVAAAAAHLIKHPRAKLEDVLEILPGPDFPGGGQVISPKEEIRTYATGRGSLSSAEI